MDRMSSVLIAMNGKIQRKVEYVRTQGRVSIKDGILVKEHYDRIMTPPGSQATEDIKKLSGMSLQTTVFLHCSKAVQHTFLRISKLIHKE